MEIVVIIVVNLLLALLLPFNSGKDECDKPSPPQHCERKEEPRKP